MGEKRSLDRRIARTRVMIFDALLAIMQKQSYAEISIVDIADKANINRSTFYAHFVDKEDLLEQMITHNLELLKESIRGAESYNLSESAVNEPDPIYLALFQHAFEYSLFYRVMLLQTTEGGFRQKLQEALRSSFFQRLTKLGLEQKLHVPQELLLDYVSLSSCGVLERWLDGHQVYSPHHMALQLTRVASMGIYRSMGIHA
ncbi:TetR family transcriptional regulator [Paenibacillus cellulosilyticus]|uniref:TetR family transcriptional regulator n=1 Tax=Paenibacillus cellulosilyticus TaxID=375489 RepID=A0A2V2YMB6_9BACL|nr:TetR/AcrR family transcriptional regulator [Paenibacillus cellulosilyticus]PWV95555.1 TetR family transcriptional regulator [Paenibacillus cellulosilyticus]QKS47367.1 TetR/AcrR family transcriptional regulator C-terminal domain-containing protein [Paenibacillus cellulosilyticus]